MKRSSTSLALSLLGLLSACDGGLHGPDGGAVVNAHLDSGGGDTAAIAPPPPPPPITDGGSVIVDTRVEVDLAPAQALPPQCAGSSVPPTSLECTGLYADIVTKRLADGVQAYAPAVALWSDDAEKHRWISLPAGTTINASDPNEWSFPVGTKLFKEFVKEGRRVETRMWHKVRDGFWVDAAYAWNATETAAMQTKGGDIPLGNGTYHIPTQDECEKCHRGRTEHILGFDQVLLGLPGATGLTLPKLVEQKLLTPPPATTSLAIGDDGTGAAAPALGWLHANCGITCHNGNSNSIAFGAKMRLRLDPRDLDGRSVAKFDPLMTTVGIKVNNPNWPDQTRIIPGNPADSLLFHLISNRGPGNQMPPIATRIVDQKNAALIELWIRRMPPSSVEDAGAASVDAATAIDATIDEAQATPDAATSPTPDAGASPESDASSD